MLTRSTRLRGVTRNTILSMDVRESSSYLLREGDEITQSTTRLKLKKERQSYQQQQHDSRQLDEYRRYRRQRFYYVLMSFAHEMTVDDITVT